MLCACLAPYINTFKSINKSYVIGMLITVSSFGELCKAADKIMLGLQPAACTPVSLKFPRFSLWLSRHDCVHLASALEQRFHFHSLPFFLLLPFFISLYQRSEYATPHPYSRECRTKISLDLSSRDMMILDRGSGSDLDRSVLPAEEEAIQAAAAAVSAS